jgi:hypothetical protein
MRSWTRNTKNGATWLNRGETGSKTARFCVILADFVHKLRSMPLPIGGLWGGMSAGTGNVSLKFP